MVIVGETPPPSHYMYRYIKKTYQIQAKSLIEEIREINSYSKMLTQSCIRTTAMHIFQRGPKPGAGKEREKCEISKGKYILR